MTYLLNERKPKSMAHLWLGADTACRLWSTGGIKQSRPGWITSPTPVGRSLCQMCLINAGTEPARKQPSAMS